MNRRNQYWIFIPVSLLLLLVIAFINRDTPFRGEHWPMLYAWVNAESWFEKLARVVNIEYFGDHRFQPLNSAPMILGYCLFGLNFFPYLLISIAMQIILALSVIALLHTVKNRNSDVRVGKLLKDYPLEFSLFLVFFPSLEVLLWTYFHYIQIATTLSVLATVYFLKEPLVKNRIKSYGLVSLSSMFYEPTLMLLVVFLGYNLIESVRKKYWRWISDFAFPLALLLSIGSQYFSGTVSKPITVPPDVSVLNGLLLQPRHDQIFLAPGAFNKLIFLIYNETLLVIHILKSVFFPAFANKTNLYELMPISAQAEAFLPLFVFLGILGLFFLRRKVKAHHVLLGIIAFCCLGVIIWGRPGAGHYASTQFRYAYLVLPFLFVLGCQALRGLKLAAPVGVSLFLYLFCVNAGSSLAHAFRLEKSFSTYSTFIKEKKNRGLTAKQIVKETAGDILDYNIPAPGHDVFLIYNGRGGMGKFYTKEKG